VTKSEKSDRVAALQNAHIMSRVVLPAATKLSLPALDGCKFCKNFLISFFDT